ncbi:anaerobic ribonucleoside-triphosphate reductase [Neobittarella massiliensis]|uniref:Anaerobic ribonucleoside triphosphate reductase n=1 Tax=uncultured Anaerotruncus sp. TaxID=905011 RepID=A0A1C6J3Q4_9FIRM|nr:anaerobic ribonucleoside-triphosphate reductase [Neobittarella massiliensis]SCJ76743.1 anaerobic ribonucleoside triphosphate reductase [uncultured Anaerotruncus sp.]
MAQNTATNEKYIGEGVGFERIRRITGYLVGTMDHWNNAKRAEEHDRVKHDVQMQKL